jgi:hypothetical protein
MAELEDASIRKSRSRKVTPLSAAGSPAAAESKRATAAVAADRPAQPRVRSIGGRRYT